MGFKIKSARYVRSFADPEKIPQNDFPQIAFAGRSNVGKSSLLNSLANRKNLAQISSTPGKTRLLNFFLINEKVYFVDLPGYGYAKTSKSTQKSWKGLVEGYLKSSKKLKGVVQIVDIRHPPFETDLELLEWLDFYNMETLVTLTKADKLSRSKTLLNQKKAAQTLKKEADSVVVFSARTGVGKDKVLGWISSVIQK